MHRTLPALIPMLFLVAVGIASANESKLNVLFIAVDDLRPDLGCYGHPQVKTPNIDRLASQGTLFQRAYCQQAVCNPSRASLMTGQRPENLGVTDLPTHFRDKDPDAVTIAQHFKSNGYHSQGIGKIYHVGHGNRDDMHSWSVQEKFDKASRYGPIGTAHLKKLYAEARESGINLKDNRLRPRGLPWSAPEVADDELVDGSVARFGVELIRRHKDQPFFLAVGFVNPHLPFVAPKKYWDLYDPETIELADNPQPPIDSPSYAWTNWGELRKYHGMPAKGPLSKAQARQAIHGYWAATSYVDALVGELLDQLDALKLREKTVVILWGDHGWQLGEHGFWCKHTNYEVAARVPLILSVPGQKKAGAQSERLVEFVDIFPTLAEICGLPIPENIDGHSFVPLLSKPDRQWKKAAFHLYPRRLGEMGKGMGRAIRTDRYRLVEWKADQGEVAGYELYDLQVDPDENRNIAAKSPEIVRRLAAQLHAGPEQAKP